MGTLLKLLIALGLDAREYDEGLDKAQVKAKSAGSSIASALQSTGAKMTAIGGAMTAAVTLPIAGMAMASINAASDLSETVSKVQVVFGESAASVLQFGETAATSLGMSQDAALSAAGTYGNLFVSMGMTTESAAGMSTGLVGLAADLASFNNMDSTEVLEKLRAGLTGETEPLKSLGVNLSAAAVESKAMEMGLAKAGEEMSATAKAQATYALILEQTKTAQGDFARTSEGLANSTRIAKAEFMNATAGLGQMLLPMALKVVQVITRLITGFNTLSPSVKKTIVIIAGIAAAVGPVLVVLGTLLGAIGGIATFLAGPVAAAIGTALAAAAPVIAIILAIVAVIGLLYAAWTNNWGGIQEKVGAVWAFLQPIFAAIVSWFQTNIPAAIAFVSGVWQTVLLPAITAVWGFIQNSVIPLFMALANVFSAVIGLALRVLAGLWQNLLLPALQAVWGFIQANILPIFQKAAEIILTVLKPPVEWIANFIATVFVGAWQALERAIAKVVEWLNRVANAIRKLDLPSWLTPGSPTPFEMGLRGISGALSELSRVQLPKFQAELELTPPNGIVSAAAGEGGGRENRIYDQRKIVIFSKENPGQIENALTLSGLLGGAG